MKLQVINSPFNEEQVKLLNELLPQLTLEQKIWLNGYLSAAQATQEPIVVLLQLQLNRLRKR